jgi:Uma2 family endonuclease
MVAEPRVARVSEFLAMPDDGNRHEFVRGEIRSIPPPKGKHGVIESFLIVEIGRYLRDRAISLGWHPKDGLEAQQRLVGLTACGEFGMAFSLSDDEHQIRGADCVYVPAEQQADVSWDGEGYFPAVPWLVVEIISPSDLAAAVEERVQDYLAGGARRVWCVYPKQRRVHVHAANGLTQVLRAPDSLVDEDLLPGFSLPVGWLF